MSVVMRRRKRVLLSDGRSYWSLTVVRTDREEIDEGGDVVSVVDECGDAVTDPTYHLVAFGSDKRRAIEQFRRWCDEPDA